MFRFLLAFLFGSTTLLTPNPVTLTGTHVIAIKPISSIDGYGSLRVDISYQIPASLGVFNSWKKARMTYSPGSIKAVLYQSNGKYLINLNYNAEMTFDKSNGTELVLEPTKKIPTGVNFDRLGITSNFPLRSVRIYWKDVSDK